ncbi:predicted protein [Aspergillus terreus NIH2624]|uniref:Uncharacterized protein n=1 Tax=Aspergillus terreus (strain NIH 2624 / FGSC A1156) TaxID=341663 RepID=Q0CLA9_ASPTN|nr:uncharacterized protein ATEG_05525 [Aspergillus terreus NIH2624]EAU34594.1 predicted protein [Aspergillus terreus NIH2624]
MISNYNPDSPYSCYVTAKATPAHTITHLAHQVHELSHLSLPLVRQPEQRKIPHSGHSLEIPIGGARWWEQTGGDNQHGPGVRGENPRVHLQILRDTGSERGLMRRKRGRQVQDVRRGIQDGLPRTKRSPLHANARVVGFRLEGLRAAGRSRGQGSPYVIVGRVVPGDLDNKPQRWVEL